MRNKRYQVKKGPLVVYGNDNVKLVKAFRNVPGVEVANVNRLNLKTLAPGGQLGRFVIWTQSACMALDNVFGTFKRAGEQKSNYKMERSVMANADISRIINSNEVQSVVTPVK